MNQDNQLFKGLTAVVVLGLVIGGVVFFTGEDDGVETMTQQPLQSDASQRDEQDAQEQFSEYVDGIYSAVGSYSSPGGNEEVAVEIRLDGGQIREISLENGASHPTSSRFQDDFIESVVSLVSGVNIDEADVSDVAGSSLTGNGFNQALEAIRSQAQG